MNVDPKATLSFANELRAARENALRDAEDFDGIVHVVERLGSFLLGRIGDLGQYKQKLTELACQSALAYDVPDQRRALHTPFPVLYDLVRTGRNDAMHQGAFARSLTTHAIQLALVLEDALRNTLKQVSDYMVNNPVCAEMWQPISFVRQQMLANSYSCLPVQDAEGKWHLVWDLDIGLYLNAVGNQRNVRLAESLKTAVENGLTLRTTTPLPSNASLDEAFAVMTEPNTTILVYREGQEHELAGLLTAFDLL